MGHGSNGCLVYMYQLYFSYTIHTTSDNELLTRQLQKEGLNLSFSPPFIVHFSHFGGILVCMELWTIKEALFGSKK